DSHESDANAIRRLVALIQSNSTVASSLLEMDETALLAELIKRADRRTRLTELRTLVEDPRATEREIQRLLEKQTWIFGGYYVGKAVRLTFAVLDQLDIPLIRGDGTLHGIEIKKANIPNLVVRHRNHLIVGPPVHEAAAQAMNYLRSLDEQRSAIL